MTDHDIDPQHVEGYIAAVADALDAAGFTTKPYIVDPDEILGGAIIMPGLCGKTGFGLAWDEITGWQLGYPSEQGIRCLTPIWLGLVPPPDQVVMAVRAADDADDITAAYDEDAEVPAEWEDAETLTQYAQCEATAPDGDARCSLHTTHDGQHRAALHGGGHATWAA